MTLGERLEQARVEDAKRRYREERAERIPPEPKGRWVPMAQLHLPITAGAMSLILGALADETEEAVVIRTNDDGSIWWVGYWGQP